MSDIEKLYQEKEVYGNNGMYRIFQYVEETGELRMVDTYTADGQIVEHRVFRDNCLCSCAITYPGREEILHKTNYREDGSVKSYSEYRDGKIYTTNYDRDENIESVETDGAVTSNTINSSANAAIDIDKVIIKTVLSLAKKVLKKVGVDIDEVEVSITRGLGDYQIIDDYYLWTNAEFNQTLFVQVLDKEIQTLLNDYENPLLYVFSVRDRGIQ